MSGVFLVVLGAVVLVVGLWATDQWLSGAPSDGGRGHPLLVVLSGATFMVVGIGLFSTPGREWTPPDQGRRDHGPCAPCPRGGAPGRRPPRSPSCVAFPVAPLALSAGLR